MDTFSKLSLESFEDLPTLILKIIDEKLTFDSNMLATELGIDHQKLIGAIKSLQTTENVNFNF